ncbi:MAG: hypothetical protein ACM3NH_01810 [Candidatus Saccharibacteria bacterium]
MRSFIVNFLVSGLSAYLAVHLLTGRVLPAVLVAIAVFAALNVVEAEAARVIRAVQKKEQE